MTLETFHFFHFYRGIPHTIRILLYGDCQNYGPFLGPYYNTGPNLGDPKRDHNFDNPPHEQIRFRVRASLASLTYLTFIFGPCDDLHECCASAVPSGYTAIQTLNPKP